MWPCLILTSAVLLIIDGVNAVGSLYFVLCNGRVVYEFQLLLPALLAFARNSYPFVLVVTSIDF